MGGTDLEIRLRNELTQKAIATECAQWIREKATFKSFKGAAGLPPSLTVEMALSAGRTETDVASYIPFNGFTTVELGAARSADAYGVICRQDGTSSRMLLNTFEQAWNSDDLDDVTDAVVDNISQMYRENPPELVYYAALYRIFHEFLDDITADELPKEGTGFRESKIWNLLYDFQRDAVLAIINKLQTYDGCILADSVGLGKTFTALAVVKYYESLNRNVLVLCPKKLGDNWLTYRNNQRKQPHRRRSSALRRSVPHRPLAPARYVRHGSRTWRPSTGAPMTLLSSTSPTTSATAPTARVRLAMARRRVRTATSACSTAWSRTVCPPRCSCSRPRRSTTASAICVTNSPSRTRATPSSGPSALGSSPTWRTCFAARRARSRVGQSCRRRSVPPRCYALADFDFFRILDQVTVARSRSHIQRYYDAAAIGPFPRRNKPVSLRPDIARRTAPPPTMQSPSVSTSSSWPSTYP